MRRSLRVCGPYPNRGKWRLVLVEDGRRKSLILPSRPEAEQLKQRLLAEAAAAPDATLGELLDEYRQELARRGVKEQTIADVCNHLGRFLPPELPLRALTAERASEIYLGYVAQPNLRSGQPRSPSTHHFVLLLAKGFGKWLCKRKLVAASPFADVEPVGRRRAGKPQLRIDEAQRLHRTALELAGGGDTAALGVLLMLHLGLRQGEVSARVARDVDQEGRILWVPFGKTESSRRRLRVPDWLRPLLHELARGKPPDGLLFASGSAVPARQYWWRKLQELCARAGVPRVCPHSLRGLHATLAIEEGATGDAVARALGHTTFAMTARHYASPDSVSNARAARVGQVLAPEPAAGGDPVGALLASLTADQLALLRRRLAD